MDTQKNSLSLLRGGNYIREGIQKDDFSKLPRPYHSFAYVVRGELLCETPSFSLTVLPGEIAFIPYKTQYQLSWLGDPKTETYSCHFLFPPFSDGFSGKEFPLQKISGLSCTKEDFAFLCENFDNKEESLAVLGRFYTLADRLLKTLSFQKTAALSERIEAAVAYMEENHQIAVEDLAGLCNMSVSRFYYHFKKETGMTPIAYKNSLLVRRASLLLLSVPRKSIEEISDAAGFESSSYFRRVFKSVMGVSPRAYRKTADRSL